MKALHCGGWKRFRVSKLSLEVVWKELEVFSKLIFRGRNQHCRDKAYQMIVRVNVTIIHQFYGVL